MGTTVLYPQIASTPNLYAYAHCLRNHSGGVALLVINSDAQQVHEMSPAPPYKKRIANCCPPGPPSGPPPSAAFFGVNTSSGSGDDATFDQAVILSGFKRRVTSQRFRFGKATAVLGGFHIDFTRADIDGSRALLHIDTVFGGGEVRVPDNWRIVIEATAVAGAFVDETYPQPVSASTPVKELIVRGAAIFGGVTIKN